MIKLSQRLQMIADLVPTGSRVADIGTDHGFLPCYLAQCGRVSQVIACDVNVQPLALAQKNIMDYNVSDVVSTRLGDGLRVITPGEVDVVTIAGMGGSLMLEILEAAPEVVERLQRIVLQPNIGMEAVRIWAEKNQWQIVQEALIRENDRFSVIIAMESRCRATAMTPAELFLGPELLKNRHPLLEFYVREEWEKTQRVLTQLAQSDSEESRQKEQKLRQKWKTICEVMACQCGVTIL